MHRHILNPFSFPDDKEKERDLRGQTLGLKKTFIELILMFFPFLMAGVLIMYPTLYFLTLDLPVLLISSIPDLSRNFFTSQTRSTNSVSPVVCRTAPVKM